MLRRQNTALFWVECYTTGEVSLARLTQEQMDPLSALNILWSVDADLVLKFLHFGKYIRNTWNVLKYGAVGGWRESIGQIV